MLAVWAQADPGLLNNWVEFIQIVIFVASVAGAALWLRRSDREQRHEELQDLAQTRGDKIADLEKEIAQLRTEVHEMRGQLQALQALKAEEIADVVVAKLKDNGL